MKALMIGAAAIATLSATPALAEGKTAQTQVTAELAQSCVITKSASSIALAAVNEKVDGDFSYRCNFTGTPSLTITSANGGVKTVDGGTTYTRNYGVYINNDSPPSSLPSKWAQAGDLKAGHTFGPDSGFLATSGANIEMSPRLYVGLTEALEVAGSYSDTLTFTIAP